jgi:hypothetical protein
MGRMQIEVRSSLSVGHHFVRTTRGVYLFDIQGVRDWMGGWLGGVNCEILIKKAFGIGFW